jgi:hypothetical protein
MCLLLLLLWLLLDSLRLLILLLLTSLLKLLAGLHYDDIVLVVLGHLCFARSIVVRIRPQHLLRSSTASSNRAETSRCRSPSGTTPAPATPATPNSARLLLWLRFVPRCDSLIQGHVQAIRHCASWKSRSCRLQSAQSPRWLN